MSEEKFSDDELRKCLNDLATHVGKFTHPSVNNKCKVVARPKGRGDGFLRSGNVKNIPDDFSGNANRSKKYAALFDMKGDYRSINLSLSVPKPTDTDEKIKQVYFPVDGGYHLLSVITPSGIVYKLKKRLTDILDKKNEIEKIYKLKKIAYGGGKEPRLTESARRLNISYLNKELGYHHLLPSLPPPIDKNKVRLPKQSFWREVVYPLLYLNDYKEIFWGFCKKHKQLKYRSNVDIKTSRDDWVRNFFDKVMVKVWEVRSAEHGWSDRRENLPEYQKKWLDNKYKKKRETGEYDSDLQEIAENMAKCFIRGYEHTVDDILGDDVLSKIQKLIDIDELR